MSKVEKCCGNSCGEDDHFALLLDDYHAANLLNVLETIVAACAGEGDDIPISRLANGDWTWEMLYALRRLNPQVPPNQIYWDKK